MIELTHGSLFSGGGGFDLAAEWMDWKNVFHVEINPFGRQILKYYWPHANSYSDIYWTDFRPYKNKIDVLSGGFPCQPFSVAGKRGGTGDSRFLWPQYLRAIREIQPTWVTPENVPGILSIESGMVFENVCTDLESEGFQVWPVVLSSVSTNADHRRERVFFIAYSQCNYDSRKKQRSFELSEKMEKLNGENNSTSGQFSGAINVDIERGNPYKYANSDSNSDGQRRHGFKENTGEKSDCKSEGDKWQRLWNVFSGSGSNVTYSDNTGLERAAQTGDISGSGQKSKQHFRRHVSSSETWIEVATRLCTMVNEFPGELDNITLSKWRTESLKMAGNAVDPDVVYQVFKAIQKAENLFV